MSRLGGDERAARDRRRGSQMVDHCDYVGKSPAIARGDFDAPGRKTRPGFFMPASSLPARIFPGEARLCTTAARASASRDTTVRPGKGRS